jgi:hypothetical protein
MRTTTVTLCALFIIFTASLNVAGQKSFLIKEIQPLIAYTSDAGHNIELSGESQSSSFSFYSEEKLRLNNWMYDRSEWLDDGRMEHLSASQAERDVPFEDWMIESYDQRKIRLSELVREDKEEPIPLLDWMTCCEDWKLASL